MVVGEEENSEQESELSGFFATVADELARLRGQYGYSNNSDAFVHWAVQQISPILPSKSVLTASATKGASDRGIDAGWFDHAAYDKGSEIRGVYFVAQGKCTDDITRLKIYGPQAAKDLWNAYNWLNSTTKGSERSELLAVKKEYRSHVVDEGRPCVFAVLVCGLSSNSLVNQVKDYNRELKGLGERNISFKIFEIRRLQGLYIARLEKGDMPGPEKVAFRIFSNYYTKRGGTAESLVAEVPLIEIYGLYKDYGLSLFGKNLRVPIARSTYNEGIERTLDDPEERANFWFYNNGLTAICDDYFIRARPDDPEAMTTVHAKQMQIVNGCQTCASIFFAASNWEIQGQPLNLLDTTSVLVRLIKVGEAQEVDSRFPHKIAQYTNSQTPITPRDLRANDPEQMRLKELFSDDWAYFLEAKKGEWKRRLELDREYRNNFDAPFMFSNEECGQAFIAFWQNEPVFAKASKRKIFEDDKRYQTIFGPDIRAEALLIPAQLWRAIKEWKKKKGYTRRLKRKTKAITSREVAKYGDLYLLSILGASMKLGWRVDDVRRLAPGILKACCENVKELMSTYKNPRRGRMLQMVREFNNSLDTSINLLRDFVKEACSQDPDLTVRNYLIRPSTWKDFEKTHKTKLKKIAQPLRLRLEST